MGRAIEHEKSIDEINMRLNQLTSHVLMLQEAVEQMLNIATKENNKETKPKKTTKKKDAKLTRAGVSGYNKPKRTPNHPKKSHVVVAKEGGKTKLIRFGQQGVSTAGKKTDKKSKARRKSFKARHAKNIKKGKMSAAYWADKVKW